MITAQMVLTLVPGHHNAAVTAAKLEFAAAKYNIVSPRCQAMFVAQLAHESGLVPQEENLSYRAARLCQVWPARFPTLASAQPFAMNPQALGDKVYSGRMGNAPGEGYKFRGRGLVQLTGRANYEKYGRMVGFDLVADPDLLSQIGVSSLVAAAFWANHDLNAAAEAGDVRTVTRAINGGTQGLDDRERLYQRAVRLTAHPNLFGEITEPPLDLTADARRDLEKRTLLFERLLVA